MFSAEGGFTSDQKNQRRLKRENGSHIPHKLRAISQNANIGTYATIYCKVAVVFLIAETHFFYLPLRRKVQEDSMNDSNGTLNI